MDFFSLKNRTLCLTCCWNISDPCICIGQVQSGEEYPNSYKFWAEYSLCENENFQLVFDTLFWDIFMDFGDF